MQFTEKLRGVTKLPGHNASHAMRPQPQPKHLQNTTRRNRYWFSYKTIIFFRSQYCCLFLDSCWSILNHLTSVTYISRQTCGLQMKLWCFTFQKAQAISLEPSMDLYGVLRELFQLYHQTAHVEHSITSCSNGHINGSKTYESFSRSIWPKWLRVRNTIKTLWLCNWEQSKIVPCTTLCAWRRQKERAE